MKALLALTIAGALTWMVAAPSARLFAQPPSATPLAQPQAPSNAPFALTALSTNPALVTGGDVLVQVTRPPSAAALTVVVAGRDVTNAFRAVDASGRTLIGVVTGLALGRSTIEARLGDQRASLEVTNYPVTGPVVSGPWQQPFICQTQAFALPDGTPLGPALDANCSSRTVVQYVYKSTAPRPAPPGRADAATAGAGDARTAQPWYRPLPNPTALPSDVASTTTTEGRTVRFIVRVETGTMNRGIYQNAILHDPTVDQAPSPTTPPAGWNRKLLAVHGSGCPSGWYIQGDRLGVSVLDEDRLSQGYAVFNNTLNHPTNSCNAFLAGETTMMGKEHFIETFGVPRYTISAGGSGGAYTSLQVADAFPGLIDGVDIRATFPDALAIALSGLDAHLLLHYFREHPQAFTEAQQVAVSGYHGMKAFLDAANQSQRTDPVPNRVDSEGYQSARWNAAVPAALRYDPASNPRGARPTVFDAAKNVYGTDPRTGFARRPFDNVGVQYGVNALRAGIITMRQFVDLNAGIGGIDADGHYTTARTVGDRDAIRRAYQTGLMLSASGGLRTIPIFDNATSNETGGYHYGWFHFALRERVAKASGGNADTMVMWRATSGDAGRKVFDRWMDAYTADTSSASPREKVVRHKPTDATNGCYDRSTPPRFVADALPFTRSAVSPCSTLYPVYSNPRHEAGGPLAADIFACTLTPVDAGTYPGPMTSAERAQLAAAFPQGVCDWSKPGVEQVPLVTWASLGPSPARALVDAPRPVSR